MRKHFLQAYSSGQWSRIEDSCQAGVPDITFCAALIVETWLEAKNLEPEKLPKRASTKIVFGLKEEQRIWLQAAQRAGRRVLVVAKCGREWFVWNNYFTEIHEGRDLETLRSLAICNYVGNFNLATIIQAREDAPVQTSYGKLPS